MLPIPLFLFKDVCYELARERWQEAEGMPPFEIRDLDLLLAALAQPYQRFEGQPLYPSVVAKAACLFRGLVKDHPLVDGNKRVAAPCATPASPFVGSSAASMQLRDYAPIRVDEGGEPGQGPRELHFREGPQAAPITL